MKLIVHTERGSYTTSIDGMTADEVQVLLTAAASGDCKFLILKQPDSYYAILGGDLLKTAVFFVEAG